MANTLYIIEDSVLTGLPQTVRVRALAETKALLGFVPLAVETRAPVKLPASISFTDSIVKLVDTDGEVSAVQNQSNRGQISNIRSSIRQRSIGLNVDAAQRTPAVPERGGVGFQWKVVHQVGNDRVGIAVTGGVASVESAKLDVLTGFAGGRSREDVEDDRRRAIRSETRSTERSGGALAGHPVLGAARYFGKAGSLRDQAALGTWDLQRKALADWPKEHQEAVGTALARLIAHEARHQYVLPHFNGGGLGAGEAVLWGQRNFEKFDTADERQVSSAVQKLLGEQRKATILLETFPAGQPSPWM